MAFATVLLQNFGGGALWTLPQLSRPDYNLMNAHVSLVGILTLLLMLFLWVGVDHIMVKRNRRTPKKGVHFILLLLLKMVVLGMFLMIPWSLQWLIALPAYGLYRLDRSVITVGYFITGEYAVTLAFGLPTLILFHMIVIVILAGFKILE